MQSLNCLQKFTCKVLKSGRIPTHIGFIMDGNRRYAKKNKFTSTYQGHTEGVKSLKKCLLFCKQLQVRQISLFCFSVQNFNRSKEEVDGLMKLCLQTFDQMSTMSEMLLKNQIKVKIIGRKQMLRDDVRNALQTIQQKTEKYDKIFVNLCFAYDSIHEIQTSINSMKESNYKNFMQGLAIPNHLDILVRTANEHRLSNFMLPQAAYAYICILKQNWPEINLLSFLKILMSYNLHYKDIVKNKLIIKQKLNTDSALQMKLKKENEQNQNQKLLSNSKME